MTKYLLVLGVTSAMTLAVVMMWKAEATPLAGATNSLAVIKSYSAVQKAEYSLDGDRWITIYPRDGIADSRLEQYELTLEGEPSTRGVMVRATDALNNTASADVAVPAASGGR